MNKLRKFVPILLIIAVIGSMFYSSYSKKASKKTFDADKQKITIDMNSFLYSDDTAPAELENKEGYYTIDIEGENEAYENEYHPPVDTNTETDIGVISGESTEVSVDLSNGLIIDDNTAKSILFGELDSYIEAGYIDKNLADTFINSDYVASVQKVNIEFGGISESGNEYSFVYSLDCTSDFYKREFGVLKVRVEDNKITYIHKFVTETFKE